MSISRRRFAALGRMFGLWASSYIGIVGFVGGPAYAAISSSLDDLMDLTIEDLGKIQITSVSKRPEPLNKAPSAIYVITRDDIRRSGADSLPEALRLAPNLEVARTNSRDYTIAARGFNTFQASNKLLVLIDGRSVYTPLHAGVYWDQQGVMLDDIERIEVISGSGGTLWGANAVNGVINVVTRHAKDTHGGLVNMRYGDVDRSVAARYGGQISETTNVRVYGTGFERGDSVTQTGIDGDDEWGGKQAGFRSDSSKDADSFTLQGDVFRNTNEHVGWAFRGYNVLGRWQRDLGQGSSLQVQGYLDSADRLQSGIAYDRLETYDIEAKHAFKPAERHSLVWGGGHRVNIEEFVTPGPFNLASPAGSSQVTNVFAQDTITVMPALDLTIGTKLEYNSYTGFEYLPSARLAWAVTDDHLLWSAISRSVRTPSRIDRDLMLKGFLDRARDFGSEELIAYELGYRGQLIDELSLSVSLYYHDYDDLRVLATGSSSTSVKFDNKMHGHIYGTESWATIQVLPWWRLKPGLNVQEKHLHIEDGGLFSNIEQHQGNDPQIQFFLRSSMNLSENVEFDMGMRAIDYLPKPEVPGYVEADARIGWHVTPRLELSLVGFNLLSEQHPETGALAGRREIRRGVMAGVRVGF